MSKRKNISRFAYITMIIIALVAVIYYVGFYDQPETSAKGTLNKTEIHQADKVNQEHGGIDYKVEMKRGKNFLEDENYEEAISHLKLASLFCIEPKAASEINYLLGMAYAKNGNIKMAKNMLLLSKKPEAKKLRETL